MRKSLSFIATLVALFVCLPTLGQSITLNPERVRNQEAVYDAQTRTVTITALAPTDTEYDWENYTYETLPYISYITIKRHTPGQEWPEEELARVTGVEPGKSFEFTDSTVVPDKQYEYSIRVYVDELYSQESFVQAYTGVTPGLLKGFTASVTDHTSTAVDFTFTAPDTTVTGAPLGEEPLSIHLLQYGGNFDYTEVHKIDHVSPGATYTYRLEGLEKDKPYTFRAMAYVGNEGKGDFSEAKVYVGLDYPGVPRNVRAERRGEGAYISWEAPEMGGRGGNYDPASTTYALARVYSDKTYEIVQSGIKDMEFTDNPDFDEERAVNYEVVAVNSAGTSLSPGRSATVNIGKALSLPFAESFANGGMTHKGWSTAVAANEDGYTYESWEFATQSSFYYFPTDEYISVAAQDGDEGLAVCKFYGFTKDGQTVSLISPHVNVVGMDKTVLKFYLYYIPQEGSKNELQVAVSRDNGAWDKLFSSLTMSGTEPGWQEVVLEVPLSENKELQFKLEGVAHEGSPISIIADHITMEQSQTTGGMQHTEMSGADNTQAEYYNLSGVRVATPTQGMYIVRKGGKVYKEMVR